MARIVRPLSDTEVKNARPKAKEYNLADGRGLYLRVKPNGTKSWLFNYSRPYTRQRSNLSFGIYPALSLAKARAMRQEALELLAQHIDPQRHRLEQHSLRAEAARNTLEVVAMKWLDIKRSKVTETHANDTLRSLQLHIFPKLGALPISELRPREVIDVIKPVASKGSLETVKRLCQRLNEIMIYAANSGVIDINPLSGIGSAFQAPARPSGVGAGPQ